MQSVQSFMNLHAPFFFMGLRTPNGKRLACSKLNGPTLLDKLEKIIKVQLLGLELRLNWVSFRVLPLGYTRVLML